MAERETSPQPLRLNFKQPPVLRASEGDTKTTLIAGYAALYNVKTVLGWYYPYELSFQPGAFSRALREKHDVRSLFNHDPNYVLGRTKNGTLTLKEDETGLWTETTPPDTQQARDVVENIRNGNVDQMSFAFVITKEQWTFSKEKDVLDICVVQDVDLYDISPVTYPQFPETSVEIREQFSKFHQFARTAWENANRPPEPVIVRGTHPEVVLAGAAARARLYAAK